MWKSCKLGEFSGKENSEIVWAHDKNESREGGEKGYDG